MNIVNTKHAFDFPVLIWNDLELAYISTHNPLNRAGHVTSPNCKGLENVGKHVDIHSAIVNCPCHTYYVKVKHV